MTDPMATILETFAGVNALRKLEVAPEPDRDDLTEFFERYADTHDGHSWIRVDTVADLLLDNTKLAALIRPEPIRSATPRKEQ